jgi:parallel beta-helix repeat protein
MRTLRSRPSPVLCLLVIVIFEPLLTHSLAFGKTVCVNPGGTSGCFSTIASGIAHAAAHDTVKVAPGTYKEDVIIGQSVSLLGANQANTIIDATGLPNGIYVNGFENRHVSDVVITGFTVENANFEGILVTSAVNVTISADRVIGNDRSLNIAAATCPGIPSFETAEDFDCGEGIHLSGAQYSTVANNTVQNNAGGILISDETGITEGNLITGNTVTNNPFDCGIIMASHPPAPGTAATSPFGVRRNTIANNASIHNGYQVPGAGAGVGIFTFLPGGRVSENVIANNQLKNNGLPGVAMHAHSPGEDLDNNVILGNTISGNGADTEDAATPGSTGINVFGVSPINGTMISQNVISNEKVDIVVNTTGVSPFATAAIHLNLFLNSKIGIDDLASSGYVDATENWWGCADGPGSPGCAKVLGMVFFKPWLSPFKYGGFK